PCPLFQVVVKSTQDSDEPEFGGRDTSFTDELGEKPFGVWGDASPNSVLKDFQRPKNLISRPRKS
ncbi:MAG TPA: hypothetical protein PLU72_12605, partial [Candidatus Ozemobacteraceae bacterium]|nr:hypothetical protein [Candidatus Ozemobacteraceae bacterium]